MAGLAPVAVYCTQCDPPWFGWEHWLEAETWLRDHDVVHWEIGQPRSGVFRVELWNADGPVARIWRYDYQVDNGGRFRVNADGELAVEGPIGVTLSELPPPHLLARRCVCCGYDNSSTRAGYAAERPAWLDRRLAHRRRTPRDDDHRRPGAGGPPADRPRDPR